MTRAGCLLCGAELRYLTSHEPRTCVLCERAHSANAVCAAGHFVCDACHGMGVPEMIVAVCAAAATADPVALAGDLMRSPRVHMHGPEHHLLVPAVLLAAAGHLRGDPRRGALLVEARRRAEAVKGGFCGFWGACGAAVGAGLFVSLWTGATPLSGPEWRLANAMTARALAVIADSGGPRCCKRDSLIAITEAVAFARAQLGLELTASAPPACAYVALNKECPRAACRFYPLTEESSRSR
jgi:hypothetical protein